MRAVVSASVIPCLLSLTCTPEDDLAAETGGEADVAVSAAALSTVASYATGTTGSATVTNPNSRAFNLGSFPAGTTVQVGTCGLSGATAVPPGGTSATDTFLRLYAGSTQLASNDDNCGGLGSKIVTTLATSATLTLYAGCYSDSSCGGTIRVDTVLDSNGKLSNVESSFLAIGATPRKLTWGRGVLVGYTDDGDDTSTSDHFQGIQRLRGTNWLVLSGDSRAGDGFDENLVYVQMNSASTSQAGRWGAQAGAGDAPLPGNSAVYRRSAQLPGGGALPDRHCGGLQVSGRFLAVGCEPDGVSESNQSHVLFYDLGAAFSSPPGSPFASIDRTGCNPASNPSCDLGEAGAVGAAKLADGSLVVAVAEWNATRVVFYRSAPDSTGFSSFSSGLWSLIGEWAATSGCADAQGPSAPDRNFHAYQSINLVADRTGGLFLLGFHNTASQETIDLFRVDLSTWCGKPACLTKLRARTQPRVPASCDHWSDFDGATGAYIDSDNESIYVYGSEPNIGDAADASDCVANKTWAELTEW